MVNEQVTNGKQGAAVARSVADIGGWKADIRLVDVQVRPEKPQHLVADGRWSRERIEICAVGLGVHVGGCGKARFSEKRNGSEFTRRGGYPK